MITYYLLNKDVAQCSYLVSQSVALDCTNVVLKSEVRMTAVYIPMTKVKVKCTLVQALRLCTGCTAHRGSRGIDLLFLDHGTRRGEGSESRPGRSLLPGKTRYPLYRRMGGPQGRSGQVQKISPPPEFDPRTVQPVAIPTALSRPIGVLMFSKNLGATSKF